MKATGLVRKVDRLGRISIPSILRRTRNIVEDEDALEIYTDGSQIILQKYQPGCTFCPNTESLVSFGGKYICPDCIKQLQKQATLDRAMTKRQVSGI